VRSVREIRDESFPTLLAGATITQPGSQSVGNGSKAGDWTGLRVVNGRPYLLDASTLTSQAAQKAIGPRNRYNGTTSGAASGTGIPTDGGQLAVEFDYYGQFLELHVYGVATAKYRIWADGKPLSAAPATVNTPISQFVWQRADLGVAKLWRIKVEMHGVGAFLDAIRTGADVLAMAPSLPQAPVFAVVGDSYADGRKATDELMGYVTTCARILGMQGQQFAAQGGQGLIHGVTHIQRAPSDLTPLNPNAILLQGSINDCNNEYVASSGTAKMAMLALISYCKTNHPTALLAVTGCLSVRSTGAPNMAVYNAECKAAADACGVPYVETAGSNPWTFGSGFVGATTGTGISDVLCDADGTHPTQVGHDLFAANFALSLREAWGLA
jgi:lysophospholipase L1-like esterase